MPDVKTEVDKIQEDIKKIKQFIAEIERLGGKMPELTKALNRLEIAVNGGLDWALAADETSKELAAYTEDLYRACNGDVTCEVKVFRKWQARSVHWTLSWEKDKSTVRLFIRNTLQRYLPKQICERLSLCRI